MSKSRPKTMHYKKVASNDTGFNYQTKISDVLTKLPTIAKRTIVRGEKTIQCLKIKRSTSHGIYIHLTSFVEGEQATTVKKSQDPDLNVASAPDGEEFVDGDIHTLISNGNPPRKKATKNGETTTQLIRGVNYALSILGFFRTAQGACPRWKLEIPTAMHRWYQTYI